MVLLGIMNKKFGKIKYFRISKVNSEQAPRPFKTNSVDITSTINMLRLG